jgi:nucleobase:cation symporter-1, NCS1 family
VDTKSASGTTKNMSGTPGGIESRSIDYVPENERHGKVWDQLPFWFQGNFQAYTIGIGFIGPFAGLSIWWTSIAAAAGVLVGTVFMAVHASQGPLLGLPQMIQSRAQFGLRGAILPLLAVAFLCIGLNIVNLVIIKQGLHGLFGWNEGLVTFLVTAFAAVLAIYGHDWLHRAFRILFWIALPFWLILTVGILSGHAGGRALPHLDHLGFNTTAFIAVFTVAASFNITYAPFVSDYSRYLPRDTPFREIATSVFVGSAAAPIWLIPIGAWMAARINASDPLTSIQIGTDHTVRYFGSPFAIIEVLALAGCIALQAYTGMLTVVTAIDAFKPLVPTRKLRVRTILVLSLTWLIGGLFFADSIQDLNNALTTCLYLLAPWTAINLADFFIVRHGRYAITDLLKDGGVYKKWSRYGIPAYLIGLAVEVPFMNIPTVYKSWGFQRLNDIDVSWVLGLFVAGAVYLVLVRGRDREAERLAIAKSDEVLGDAVSGG